MDQTQVKKMVEEAAKGIKEKLEAVDAPKDVEELKELAGKLGEEAATIVRKYPLQCAAGAFALGCFVGLLLGRRNT